METAIGVAAEVCLNGRYRIRTCDLVRVEHALYPTELTAHKDCGYSKGWRKKRQAVFWTEFGNRPKIRGDAVFAACDIRAEAISQSRFLLMAAAAETDFCTVPCLTVIEIMTSLT